MGRDERQARFLEDPPEFLRREAGESSVFITGGFGGRVSHFRQAREHIGVIAGKQFRRADERADGVKLHRHFLARGGDFFGQAVAYER